MRKNDMKLFIFYFKKLMVKALLLLTFLDSKDNGGLFEK